jgi:hypothetical protein
VKKTLREPVVSENARKWTDGQIDSHRYFEQARSEAKVRARKHVAARRAARRSVA